MLSANFFDIQSFAFDNTVPVHGKLHSVVSLFIKHPVYGGHFPGNPVVPGVCQVQMVKELVEKAVDCQLVLCESDNIKFLSMINPEDNPILDFDILISPFGIGMYSVSASIQSGGTVFLKFKGKFEPEK
jgi:3-hydroxyacyl-[acyl-carrier-protein] dehydratase